MDIKVYELDTSLSLTILEFKIKALSPSWSYRGLIDFTFFTVDKQVGSYTGKESVNESLA